jgi:ADP-heptose:LPS heptosyltransferase
VIGAAVAGALVADVHKIAVLRANAIGDFVFALPALAALRTAYPSAEVVLLGLPWHAEFLHGRPGPVDRVAVVPHLRGVRDGGNGSDEKQVDAFLEAMRAERFDLAFQLHGGGRHSNPLVKRLGARVTFGLRSPDAEALDYWIPYSYFQPEIVRYLEVVALAGAAPARLDPVLETTAADRAEAAQAVPASPAVLLHPGASDPRRRWPVAAFAEVGNALREAGAAVLVNGAAPEAQLCERLVREVPGAINLCSRLSLGGLLGVLARCTLVVSNDTGPLHLAAAAGTRTIGLYWCFNLVNSSQLTRAQHRPFVSWTTHCPTCARDCTDGRCAHEVSFVASVPVSAVRQAALETFAAALEHSRPAQRRDLTRPQPSPC